MSLFGQRKFELVTSFEPCGDQPVAIAQLTSQLQAGSESQVLLGVTGSGKTFTMANVIAQLGLPTLILSHNKTLAAQLFSEFRAFFPKNAVEYFVSYYDYYQPEAYVPQTDTFIEKDAQINDELDKLRHSATRSLLERNDVIIVSSVSCIYGLGSPEAYEGLLLYLEVGRQMKRSELLKKLVEIQYKRSDVDFTRGTFRVRGDQVDIFPAYEEERGIRIDFFGDEIESIIEMDPLTGSYLQKLPRVTLYPASHYVTTLENRKRAMETIRLELRDRLEAFKADSRILEAERLSQRTLFDLEMLESLGYCAGIENYSRHLTGRPPGGPPPTLLEYFPKKWLLIVDESHVTVPQIGGMSRADRARKQTLVSHGFRLPSALDNRPLHFEEWEKSLHQTLYVSATPGNYELDRCGGEVVEQVIRPTGLLDPSIEVRPATTQAQDLLIEVRKRVEKKERVLVTTLTKKFSEELTRFYRDQGIRVKYLHSDIETLERIEIIRDLRMGLFDVLIGINLLREGLDIPEVSLVAILDADKEGFLRSERSLIQTIGRAARNSAGHVILYANHVTQSMQKAMTETLRRRELQTEYNRVHGIQPQTIQKEIHPLVTVEKGEEDSKSSRQQIQKSQYAQEVLRTGRGSGHSQSVWSLGVELDSANIDETVRDLAGEFFISLKEFPKILDRMNQAMTAAAADMKFEEAAALRDRLRKLKTISRMGGFEVFK